MRISNADPNSTVYPPQIGTWKSFDKYSKKVREEVQFKYNVIFNLIPSQSTSKFSVWDNKKSRDTNCSINTQNTIRYVKTKKLYVYLLMNINI